MGVSIRRGSDSWFDRVYDTFDLPEPGPLIGNPSPQQILNSIQESGSTNQTVMFIGPTGSGKSTIAHHIAAQARGPNSKVLKLDDASVSVASSKEIRHLVELLKPDVLLLDDIQERLAPLLEVLENVRGVFLVLTFMLDKKIDPKKPGALYFPGMRPGRVDHVFYIGLPDEAKRNEILRSYIKHIRDDYAEFLALSAGLPSAYLHKAALMYESQTWRDGLVHLIACAPDLGNSTPTSLS